MKIIKKKIGGGGSGWGSGGGSVWWGGQGGCERRIEVFVKIQKKNWGGGEGERGEGLGRVGGEGLGRGGGRAWVGGGLGVRVDVTEK